MTEGDGKDYQKNCAAAFIDSNHYYVVKTEASQDQLKAFINVLSFEKMSIDYSLTSQSTSEEIDDIRSIAPWLRTEE